MHVLTYFDDFEWQRPAQQRGLALRKGYLVRDANAPLEPYAPNSETIDVVRFGAYEGDALGAARRIGFLTVAHDATTESVSAWLAAAGEIAQMRDVPLVEAGFVNSTSPANYPHEWQESMERFSFASSKLSAAERAAKRARELADAQDAARKEHRRQVKAQGIEEAVEQHARVRLFNTRGRLNVRATIESKTLVLRPATLADWCWYRLAGIVARTVKIDACAVCKKPFDVDLTDGRERKKQFCSVACKMKDYRQRTKLKARST